MIINKTTGQIVHRDTSKVKCCICGTTVYNDESHNPYPVREYSFFGSTVNRCCAKCNKELVIPMRIMASNISETKRDEFHKELVKSPEAVIRKKAEVFLALTNYGYGR